MAVAAAEALAAFEAEREIEREVSLTFGCWRGVEWGI